MSGQLFFTNESDAILAISQLDGYIFLQPRKHIDFANQIIHALKQAELPPQYSFMVQLQTTYAYTMLGKTQHVLNLLYTDLPRYVSSTDLYDQRELYNAWIDCYRATFLTIVGDYRDVQQLLTNAIQVFESVHEVRGIAIAEATFAMYCEASKRYQQGLEHTQRVRSIFDTTKEQIAPGSHIFALMIEASILVGLDKIVHAAKVLNEALDIAKTHELQVPHISAAFAELATQTGDFATAEYWYNHAIAATKEFELGDHFVTMFFSKYALFLLGAGDRDGASDVIESVAKDLPPDNEQFEPNVTTLRIAAQIYSEMGVWDKAFEYYHRFLRIDLRQQKSTLHHSFRIRTAAKELAQLEYEANHDALTGLLNRKGFQSVVVPRQTGRNWGMLSIDTDRFKEVNDTHGHLVGDAVLKQLGLVLRRHTLPGGTSARVGGEEFLIFVPGTPHDLQEAADKYLNAVRNEPWSNLLDGTGITVSIGGAHASNGVNDIYQRADDQLYRAKRAGRNQYLIEE